MIFPFSLYIYISVKLIRPFTGHHYIDKMQTAITGPTTLLKTWSPSQIRFGFHDKHLLA
jgi:hypothetical protein